jgi:hypothetical protein
MEVFVFPTGTTIIICVLSVLLAVIPWYLLNKLWLKPNRFEKLLKAQGFQGEPYKLSLFVDNSKQNYMLKLQQEDKSKSIGLSKGPSLECTNTCFCAQNTTCAGVPDSHYEPLIY